MGFDCTYYDGLVQERHNSNALEFELPLSYTNPSIYSLYIALSALWQRL